MRDRLTILLVASLAFTAAGCSDSSKAVDTAGVQGKWKILEMQGFPQSEECQNISFEIDATTIVTYSGNLIVRSSFHATKTDRGMRLEIFDTTNNGARNCQGIPADYVMSHLVDHMDLEMIGGRMRMYFPDSNSGSYADFVRVGADPRGAT